MGRWMLHSMECNRLWELDLRRKRGHVARSSGCLSARVGVGMVRRQPNKDRARQAIHPTEVA
jgi:hypothetical protein